MRLCASVVVETLTPKSIEESGIIVNPIGHTEITIVEFSLMISFDVCNITIHRQPGIGGESSTCTKQKST